MSSGFGGLRTSLHRCREHVAGACRRVGVVRGRYTARATGRSGCCLTSHCSGAGGRRGPCESSSSVVPARPLNVGRLCCSFEMGKLLE